MYNNWVAIYIRFSNITFRKCVALLAWSKRASNVFLEPKVSAVTLIHTDTNACRSTSLATVKGRTKTWKMEVLIYTPPSATAQPADGCSVTYVQTTHKPTHKRAHA